MILTASNLIILGGLVICGFILGLIFFYDNRNNWAFGTMIVTLILLFFFALGLNLYIIKTENEQNSIQEITIIAEDGREIFHYEGKVDVKTSHDKNRNYISFESEEGLHYTIYYGIQDTLLIIEKAE